MTRIFVQSRAKCDKLAQMKDNRFVCPYCGSVNVWYAEDRTVRHRINRVLGPDLTATIESKGEMLEMAVSERILCGDCVESSGIPAMCELVFE